MVHTEEENIALRQTVRDLPDNPSPIEMIPYEGKRLKKLNLLTTAHVPTITLPDEPAELPAIATLPPPLQYTYTSRIFQATNNYVFANFPIQPHSYIITSISFVYEGGVAPDVYWALASSHSPIPTWAQFLANHIILPIQPVLTWADLPICSPWSQPLINIGRTLKYTQRNLCFALYTDGVQGGDNYITWLLSLTELTP